MTFQPKSCLTISTLLISILLPGAGALSQTSQQQTQRISWQFQSGTKLAAATSTPQPSPARRKWEATRDWAVFMSGVIGDTVVKDSLKDLLASGVSVNTADKLGRSALHVAAMLGQTELAQYLLLNGADVNARDQLGRSPVMISAGLGGLKMFSGFLSPWSRFWVEPICSGKGVGDSHQTEELMRWYGIVPAHHTLVQLLIKAGADVNAADGEGHTVLDYAGAGGLTGIDQLIWASGRVRGGQQCKLKLPQSPALRGLRLGMSLSEVSSNFPRYNMPEADPCGRINFSFDNAFRRLKAFARRPEEFDGVGRISLAFFEGRLTYVRVTYDRGIVWRSTDDYLAALSASLGLPEFWYRAGANLTADNAHMMGCEGFKVVGGYFDGPYVELHDTAAVQAMLQRKVEADAARRREVEEEMRRRRGMFKP